MTSGANPISFNKKNKGWTSRTLVNPPPAMSDNISFLSYLPLPPPAPHHHHHHHPQSGRHMCITPINTKAKSYVYHPY